jgi:hypothetical protein
MLRRRKLRDDGTEVTLRGDAVHAVSPEGQTVSVPIETLWDALHRAHGRSADSGGVLPDGVKLVRSRGPVTIWVYERAPQVHSFKWIAAESPAEYGRGTAYRNVRIALPYLVVVAVFVAGPRGRTVLSSRNECFFRCDPLKTVDDPLYFPALLNCSKFPSQEGKPLSWICTAKLRQDAATLKERDENRRMHKGLNALLHCLLETGFNRSSEHHEGSSWFTESASVDPRIATVERWEQATAESPLFVLDVPWLPTRHTVGQVVDRIFALHGARARQTSTAQDVARLVFNHAEKSA